jgi:hypothetical protein
MRTTMTQSQEQETPIMPATRAKKPAALKRVPAPAKPPGQLKSAPAATEDSQSPGCLFSPTTHTQQMGMILTM